MPRASRYFIPGNIWHITHRCHNRDFLFRARSEREKWVYQLYLARKRYGIKIMNYIVTSNHIHLLIKDESDDRSISRFMQLLQGRTAQAYNETRSRKGAFWEDRYHATAVESDDHLVQCLVYIDLNMVRAGVVGHPSDWKESGYHEIQHPKKRNVVIDYKSLFELHNVTTREELQQTRKALVDTALARNQLNREGKWSETVAVGSQSFLEKIRHQLGSRAKHRTISKSGDNFTLSESEIPYRHYFGPNFEL